MDKKQKISISLDKSELNQSVNQSILSDNFNHITLKIVTKLT